MKMRMNMKEIKDKVAAYCSSDPHIKVGYIFGSTARGNANKLSDIDIAILVDDTLMKKAPPYGYKARILTNFSKALGTDKVDLVMLNKAPSLLRHRVIRYGEVVYSRAESDRIRFQVKTIDDYNDIKRLMAIRH